MVEGELGMVQMAMELMTVTRMETEQDGALGDGAWEAEESASKDGGIRKHEGGAKGG